MSEYKSILELTNEEVKDFFLENKSYFSENLPPYFNFENVLNETFKQVSNKRLCDCHDKGLSPNKYDDICHKIITNKDSQYAWRPLTFIHPILYCLLVKEITDSDNWNTLKERFKLFQEDDKIECLSIPIKSYTQKANKALSISSWFNNFEQQSIKFGLDYEYMATTDISDCYSSFYTHSIDWAISSKEIAKSGNGNKFGAMVDTLIRNMRYGQSIGIPQGSVLMDFVAEIILGYIDSVLSKKLIGIGDYRILRYRDDYRIFSRDKQVVEHILKYLAEVLIEMGLKLNSSKTIISNDIIRTSIKSDKLDYIGQAPIYARDKYCLFSNIQKELLFIYSISNKYPNSGIVCTLLTKLYKRRIEKVEQLKTKDDTEVLISITVSFIKENPRAYPICFAIISKLLELDKSLNFVNLQKSISRKLSLMPNTEFMNVWLQRISYPIDKTITYTCPICKLEHSDTSHLWNYDWVKTSIKEAIINIPIVDKEVLSKTSSVIARNEIDIFTDMYAVISKDFE